jgi:hypothetical protein
MSSKKSISIHGRRTGLLSPRTRRNKQTLPPFFLSMKLRRSIERLLPLEHHQRLHLYFDIYGCIRCSRNDVVYGSNGICNNCLGTIGKRLKKVDNELRARSPEAPPDLNDAYLRPYRSARQLLADLVPKMGTRSTQQKPEPKSPPKVYLKWLT